MSELADGRYDVFVVDAETVDETTMRIELAVMSGDAKGNMFALRGPHLASDAVLLLGLPGTLVVTDGIPRLELER